MDARIFVGSVPVCFDIETPRLMELVRHAFFHDACPPLLGDRRSAIRVSVRPSDSCPANPPRPLKPRRFAFGGGLVYEYDPDQVRYFVETADAGSGWINFSTAESAWACEQEMLPRSELSLCILDPLSLLLPEQNVMICHSAAVTDGHFGTLLIGKSGFGKSTLSLLLSHGTVGSSLRILSDDCVVLDFNAEPVTIYPINVGIGVTADLATRLNLRLDSSGVLQESKGKIYLASVPNQSFRPTPVRRVVFLDKRGDGSTATVAQRMPPGAALVQLLAAQTSLPNPYMVGRANMWSRLAAQAELVRISYSEICDTHVLLDVVLSDR